MAEGSIQRSAATSASTSARPCSSAQFITAVERPLAGGIADAPAVRHLVDGSEFLVAVGNVEASYSCVVAGVDVRRNQLAADDRRAGRRERRVSRYKRALRFLRLRV